MVQVVLVGVNSVGGSAWCLWTVSLVPVEVSGGNDDNSDSIPYAAHRDHRAIGADSWGGTTCPTKARRREKTHVHSVSSLG